MTVIYLHSENKVTSSEFYYKEEVNILSLEMKMASVVAV